MLFRSLSLNTSLPGWISTTTAQSSGADLLCVWGGGSWLVFYFDTTLGYWRRTTNSTNLNAFTLSAGTRFQLRRAAGAQAFDNAALFATLFPSNTTGSLSLNFGTTGGSGTYSLHAVAIDTNANLSGAATITWSYGADTDGDGIPDSIEAQLGTNPSVAKQTDTTNAAQLKIIKPN